MPTAAVFVILAVTIAIITVVVIKPEITVARGGKILAFVGLFVFPGIVALLGFDNHVERSKKTTFCLSCHIMGQYGKSLYVDDPSYIPAAHFQNGRVPREEACYTCHTDYTIYYGGIKAKMRGLHHIYVQYLGKPNNPIHLYTPYNNRECLHCHEGSRSFEQGAVHTADPQIIADIKSNKLSCLSSGCHDTIHNIPKLNQVKYWEPPK